MKQTKWFERKFDFSYKQNIFPSILEQLENTPHQLVNKVQNLSPEILELKPKETWSIKENIGHLADLEPIWQGRLEDILSGKEYLRTADLENKQTDLAQHNQVNLTELLSNFQELRLKTTRKLALLTEKEIYQTALHPRLHQPMRTMDLFLFVAEHDEHHLNRITESKSLILIRLAKFSKLGKSHNSKYRLI